MAHRAVSNAYKSSSFHQIARPSLLLQQVSRNFHTIPSCLHFQTPSFIMQTPCLVAIISLSFSITTFAFPRETAIAQNVQPTHAVAAEPPGITSEGTLRCSDGATILHTTDCTMGTPVSFCYKPRPPITCDEGYFPSVWHPDHCMQEPTCFPTDADWITTECSNGAYPYSTETLYSGALVGEDDAIVTCECNISLHCLVRANSLQPLPAPVRRINGRALPT